MSFCSKKLITSNEKLLRLNNEYIKENEKCLWAELRVAALHSKAHRNSKRNNFFLNYKPHQRECFYHVFPHTLVRITIFHYVGNFSCTVIIE